MTEFAGLSTMDVWYASLDEDKIKAAVRGTMDNIAKAEKSAKSAKKKKTARKQAKLARKGAKRALRASQKAHTRDTQAASDIYLGWTRGPRGRHFYWRQLRDMKVSAAIEAMTPLGLTAYARVCGWTLARAHARSGDPVAIAAYLGDGDDFDRAVTDFALRYADQNERDYAEFVAAVNSGTLTAAEGV
jgi:Uncharacterized protein conserved in bacteria (DUF2252)